MNTTAIIALIALPFSALSAVTAFLGFRAGEKRTLASENKEIGSLRSDIEYIKKSLDSLVEAQRETVVLVNKLTERVARLEEAQKFLRKRGKK